VPSATDDITAAIRAAGGTLGFDRYMELALYGDHGFYTGSDFDDPTPGGGGAAGRRGDFITSPEVGPLFGTVVARMLDAEWERLGRPDRFSVVEVGAGSGTLARAVLAAAPASKGALVYTAVEISARQRAQHPDGVVPVASLDAVAGAGELYGVVLANELLDNVPFRLAVFDGGWREAFVVESDDGGFAEVLSAPFDPAPAMLPASAPHGARVPLQDGARTVVETSGALLASGSVHVFDYCRPLTADLALLPWREWLRTYRGHQRAGHYLSEPGSCDITGDVAVDQLPPPDAVRTQAQFLERWGIADLVDEGRRYWSAHSQRPDVAALKMRSRVSEAEALLDPAGLGGFTVLEYRR
jgi:SAM-dependent MidA family methyltransferase